jgi:hypothetical protein
MDKNAIGREGSRKMEILVKAAVRLTVDDVDGAKKLINSQYPFVSYGQRRMRCARHLSMRVFLRDGFIDRYSGVRLVMPAALRLLSIMLPEEIPFHPNWKSGVTHPAFWEFSATIDHVVPVARGGAHVEGNMVTTSMARNSAKANWTLEELQWSLRDPGDVKKWDGLTGWFLRQTTRQPNLLTHPYLRAWRKVAEVELREHKSR